MGDELKKNNSTKLKKKDFTRGIRGVLEWGTRREKT